MAEYFHRLSSHAEHGRLAIIDPQTSSNTPPRQWSYAQLLSRVNVFREELIELARQAGGGGKELEGARIGLMVPPGIDFIAALLGIWSVRAIAVPICLTHPLGEIMYTVTDSDQDFIIYHADFRAKIESLVRARCCIDLTTVGYDVRPKTNVNLASLHLPADIPCNMTYTSGTTGQPKGVVHTPGSLEHTSRSLEEMWRFTPQDRVLHVLPLHHGHGMNLALLLPLWSGATVEFMAKFDEARVWKRLMDTSSHRITVFMAVPTIWVKMIAYFNASIRSNPERAVKAKRAASGLRLAISGSAALPAPVRNAWAEIADGYLLLERYGTSETGITYSGHLGENGRILGSVGWPLPGVQTRLIDPDGRDVSNIADVMGEIQVKSEGLLKEYWRKPGAKEKEITADGWWRTGDMALVKAEHNMATFIQGRASTDIIKSGGFKISALEIETQMLQLPFIEEVAVLGLPDETWGEMVTAVCVPKKGKDSDLNLENVRESLRSELAAYKLPQKIHVLKQLPRNAMGKVQKKALRQQCFPEKRDAKL